MAGQKFGFKKTADNFFKQRYPSGTIERLTRQLTTTDTNLGLSKATTSEISKKKKPTTLDESKVIAKLEVRTGDKVVSKLNAKQIAEGKPKKKLK